MVKYNAKLLLIIVTGYYKRSFEIISPIKTDTLHRKVKLVHHEHHEFTR